MFKQRCIHNELLRTEPEKRRRKRGGENIRERAREKERERERRNMWRWIFPPSFCICSLPGYCSLLKTGPTAGKPVVIFRAKQNTARRTIIREHAGWRYFPFPTLKGILLSSKITRSCPWQREVILLLLSNMPVSMCCEAQSVCQSLDQYSLRCVKECSGWGNYGWVRVDSYPPGP